MAAPPRPRHRGSPPSVPRTSSSRRRPRCCSTSRARPWRWRRRARVALRGPLARGLRRDAPEAYRGALAALAAARRAASDGDEVELAAAAGSLRAALLLGSYRTTVAAVAAGDAERAASWLLLREFRKATRFTRPGVDATVAVRGLAAGRLAPRKATLEVRKDLLDAYQASLTTRLGEAEAAAERGFDARWAQTAAARRRPLADRRSRVPDQPRRRGRRAGRRAPSRDLASSARRGRFLRALRRLAPRSRRPLDGFVAAPFTRAEQARRAAQLVRFLDLVPIEYDRGTDDGRVTLRLRDPGGGGLPARERPRRSPTSRASSSGATRARRPSWSRRSSSSAPTSRRPRRASSVASQEDMERAHAPRERHARGPHPRGVGRSTTASPTSI